MENKQLVKKLEKVIEDYNNFYCNNYEMADEPFYKSQIVMYNTDIVNLCKQIESLHTEENKPIL